MDRIIVQLPAQVQKQLNKRAKSEGKDPQAVAAEILARELGTTTDEKSTPTPSQEPTTDASESVRREHLYRTLREQGMWVDLGDELKKYIIPGIDRDQVFEAMGQTGGKPLSQIVIEQRQERHDILVYGHKRARKKVHAREREQSGKKTSRRKSK
jgi:hypothetical protein